MPTHALTDELVCTAYARHADALTRWLTTFTRQPALAEDLTQEAFVRLLLEVRAGRTPDDIGAWLHRVGRNLAVSRARRVAVANQHQEHVATPRPSATPETLVIAAEDEAVVCRAVAGLRAQDRQAMIMAAYGYQGTEIGRSLGRTQGAVRTMLCRARARVRADVGGQIA
jgi:RNA polymerase sigma-70 factor (ECF subfamily)